MYRWAQRIVDAMTAKGWSQKVAAVDVVTVSRRLGHSSVSVTDRFYLRPRRAADEGAARAFDALVVATARDSVHLRAKKSQNLIESC